jgi:hypothetical protein
MYAFLRTAKITAKLGHRTLKFGQKIENIKIPG